MKEVGTLKDFEDFKHENGITYWWASEMAAMLGYPDLKSFKKVGSPLCFLKYSTKRNLFLNRTRMY